MKAARRTQAAMVPNGDDLPLFSGAAPRVREPAPAQATHVGQPRLFGCCPVCLGTRLVIVKHGKPARPCWCTGIVAYPRQPRRPWARRASSKEPQP